MKLRMFAFYLSLIIKWDYINKPLNWVRELSGCMFTLSQVCNAVWVIDSWLMLSVLIKKGF